MPRQPMPSPRSVPSKGVADFARKLSAMVDAGVPLPSALETLHATLGHAALGKIIGQVREALSDGVPLSAALGRHPEAFDRLFVNMVGAGERSEFPDRALGRLAAHLDQAQALDTKVKSALVYPFVVLGIATTVVLALIMFVLPQFKSIFDSMNVELPAVTKALLAISDILQDWWMVIIPGLLSIPFAIAQVFRSSRCLRWSEAIALRLPVAGPMTRAVAVARFTRTLGTTIAAGLPILEALDIAASATGSVALSRAMNRTRPAIRDGESIARSLDGCSVLPAGVLELISVGEEHGALDTMLLKNADVYDAEVDRGLSRLTSIIEPLVIVFMGLVIGGIVLAVFMPMLKISNNVG